MRYLMLLFIAVPILEMWVLIEVGSEIGALSTIALVFLTAAIGLALLRQQGFETITRMNQRMSEGQLPAAEILESVALAVGGALLLTPGFITDIIGFACLIPFTRRIVVAFLLKHGISSMANGQGGGAFFTSTTMRQNTQFYQQGRPSSVDHSNSEVIEGDFRREDENKPQK
jgi:UPF0716 protein FxsA